MQKMQVSINFLHYASSSLLHPYIKNTLSLFSKRAFFHSTALRIQETKTACQRTQLKPILIVLPIFIIELI